MRKVVYKGFFVWNFEKEEKWLNEMAAKGFALISVGPFRYEFEDSLPDEYEVRLELLKKVSITLKVKATYALLKKQELSI